VPNTGAQYSEHESIVQGPPVNGQPTTKIVTEVTESDPAAAPVDTKTTSFSKTVGAKPALVAADPPGNGAGPPPNTANNVPGAGKPAKPMYDTNHPKEPKVVPVTTNSNVPNAPSGGAPGPPAPPPPAMVESDLGNMPTAPAGGAPPPPRPAAAAPGGAAGPAPGAAGPTPGIMATPAPASKVGGLWWEPHLPTQTRPNTPA